MHYSVIGKSIRYCEAVNNKKEGSRSSRRNPTPQTRQISDSKYKHTASDAFVKLKLNAEEIPVQPRKVILISINH